ncbi:MAG: hypothetical protein ACR2LX_11190 [Jatrophihabitans sp.]
MDDRPCRNGCVATSAAVRAAGFESVRVIEMSAWQGAERALWTATVAADPHDDATVQSLRKEGTRGLEWIDRVGRVLLLACS